MWNTIKKWLDDFVAKIKSLFADLDPQSENGRIVRDMGDRLDSVRHMWADMVVESGEIATEATQEQVKNSRKGLEKLDADYLSAVERGDMETAQRMVDEVANTTMPDSKIRTEDGKLRVVYHGTNAGDFTVFNPDYIGMSSGDDGFFGMGFYFAYSKGEASYYGSSRVIPAYLNLKNPFNFEKELQSYQGKRASGGYAPDAVALMNFADKFSEIAKNVKIGVVENGSDTVKDITLVEFSKAFKDVIENKTFEYREVENEFGEKETVVTADAKTVEYQYDGKKHSYTDYGFQKRFWGTPNELDVAYEYLANSVYEYVDMIPRTRLILDNNREFTAALKDMGYDGTIQSEHGDEAVAFYPNQIKSAESITYDDNGSVIPLSQRFNSENEDIRYSRKGVNKDGIEVYETSEETMKLTWKEREAKYLDLMKNEYRGRTAKFIRNGHTFYAQFDPKGIRKVIKGDSRSRGNSLKALIKAGADGDIFELVERSKYTHSSKNRKNHTPADYFDYFVKTVQIDGKVFDLIADVEKMHGGDGGYVYTLALTENKTIKASPAHEPPEKVSVKGARNASNDSIAQNTDLSTVSAKKVEDGIKSSRKTVDPITSREELAKALSKVAKGSDRAIVESYKANVNLIKGETARLESLRKEIDEIKYKKSITYEGRE